jgi:pantoate--beta-alanine ligase
MRIIATIAELQHQVRTSRSRGERVALVPVFGHVREGDADRARTARAQCDLVVVVMMGTSAPGLDQRGSAKASRTGTFSAHHADDAVADLGADLVWHLDEHQLSPHGTRTMIRSEHTQRAIAAAPGTDVDYIVTRIVQLIGCVGPQALYLDDGDLVVHATLASTVSDLHLPVDVRTVPVSRDADGMALANALRDLEPADRQRAATITQALQRAAESVHAGSTTTVGRLRAQVEVVLAEDDGIDVEFVELVDPATLAAVELLDRPARLVAAVHVGSTRLIDHVDIHPPASQVTT